MESAGMNIELDEAAIERRPTDTQSLGGFCSIALGIGESGKQAGFLVPLLQGNPVRGSRRRRYPCDFRWKITGSHLRPLAADHRKFNGAPQFTYVSRPDITHQSMKRLRIETVDGLPGSSTDGHEKGVCE